MSQPFFFYERFLISLKEETYLARKGASARALVAVACMVFVSVSYDVNVEPAKVVLTRVSFVTKKKVSRENVLFVFFSGDMVFWVFVSLVRSNFFLSLGFSMKGSRKRIDMLKCNQPN